jgi:hypothetical protein
MPGEGNRDNMCNDILNMTLVYDDTMECKCYLVRSLIKSVEIRQDFHIGARLKSY